MHFINEMGTYLNEQAKAALPVNLMLQFVSFPHFGQSGFFAAPAQFGKQFDGRPESHVIGELALADPLKACGPLQNPHELNGRIAVVRRGSCMFEDKARLVQKAGAIGVIIIDNQPGTTIETAPMFSMSTAAENDNNEENSEKGKTHIPASFLFYVEGQQLLDHLFVHPKMIARLGQLAMNPAFLFVQFLHQNPTFQRQQFPIENQFLTIDAERTTMRVVERNLEWLSQSVQFPYAKMQFAFIGHVRVLAYSLLGYPNGMGTQEFNELRQLIKQLRLRSSIADNNNNNINNNEQPMMPPPPVLPTIGSRSIICNLRNPLKSLCSIV